VGSFDDARLAAAQSAVAEIERGVRFLLDTSDSPAELARGWEAYRGAVGLRKALDKWMETRRWRSAHARECDPVNTAKV
jgi:hypothetical protein